MEIGLDIHQCHCECGCKRINPEYICELCKAGLCKQTIFGNYPRTHVLR